MRPRTGDRITFTRALEAWGASVEQGETGEIADIDPETGDVIVRLDAAHPELDCWHNLVPLPAADALERLALGRRRWSLRAPALALCFVIAFAAGLNIQALLGHHVGASVATTCVDGNDDLTTQDGSPLDRLSH